MFAQRDGEGATMVFSSKVGDIGLQLKTVKPCSALVVVVTASGLKEAISISRSLSLENGASENSLEPTPPHRGTTHDSVADLAPIIPTPLWVRAVPFDDNRIAWSVAGILLWVESYLKM